jgi:hypothetical protein
MKITLIIPLVNWGMGAIITGVFAVVGVVMIFIVYHLVTTDKKIQQMNKYDDFICPIHTLLYFKPHINCKKNSTINQLMSSPPLEMN